MLLSINNVDVKIMFLQSIADFLYELPANESKQISSLI